MAVEPQTFELGNDAYGRRVTATRKQTYDGKVIWEIATDPASQRDEGEKTSGLSDENIRALAAVRARLLSP